MISASSRVCTIWTTEQCGWYEWLGILWAQASRFYEQLMAMDDMNDSMSWSQGYG